MITLPDDLTTLSLDDLQTRHEVLNQHEAHHEAQTRFYRTQRLALEQVLAARLSGISVGATVEVPKRRYREGRWRVIGHDMSYGRPQLLCTNVKKDGTLGQHRGVRLDPSGVTVVEGSN